MEHFQKPPVSIESVIMIILGFKIGVQKSCKKLGSWFETFIYFRFFGMSKIFRE